MGTRIVAQYLSREIVAEGRVSTVKLYELEQRARDALKRAAQELVCIKHALGVSRYDLWEDGVPEMLAVLADAFANDLEIHRVELAHVDERHDRLSRLMKENGLA